MLLLKNITKFLNDDSVLNQEKLDEVFALLYLEVKIIANAQLSKYSNAELSPTLLVNECYIKLKKSINVNINNRQHFYSLVARCMRFYLIDLMRKQYQVNNLKRTEFSITQFAIDDTFDTDLFDLEYALKNLEIIDKELLNIVELRFFGGLSLDEIAELFNSNKTSVYRKWKLSKSLLINLIEEKQQTIDTDNSYV